MRTVDEENLRGVAGGQGCADLEDEDGVRVGLGIEGEDTIEGSRGSKTVHARKERLSSKILAGEDSAAREGGSLAIGGSGVSLSGRRCWVPEMLCTGIDTGWEA